MFSFFAIMIAGVGCSLLILADKKPPQSCIAHFFQIASGVLLAALGIVLGFGGYSLTTSITVFLLAMPVIAIMIALMTAISRSNQSYKRKNDEKRKRAPASWEMWPKKKKRGLPPE